jgi:ATP-dependent helicase/nuclease subunit B
MIKVLGGRAGRLWAGMAQQLKISYKQGKSVVLLVPEQYTLQAERDALEALGVPGFFRLQVFSPSRLANYVFERAGRDPRVLIDERGKLMTMARALWKTREGLRYYTSAREKTGFAHKLTETVSELKSVGLSPADFAAHLDARGEEDLKLRDLSLLYGVYEGLLQGRLRDKEDEGRELLRRLSDSDLFAGADFLVYGFDLLSQPLIHLISACAPKAGEMRVSLVMDSPDTPDGDAFEPVRQSARRLADRLAEMNLPCVLEYLREPSGLPGDLAHLEQHLLTLRADPWPETPEHLRLYAGRTGYEEVRWAAQHIHKELQGGVAPGDIAVLYAQAGYEGLIPGVFEDYRIPHYLAKKEPILAHALIRCLLDALNCIKSATWKQEDVISYAKSPFSPLSLKEAWTLENWALRWGIHGKRWTQPFTRGNAAAQEELEALRSKAVSPVVSLRDGLVKAKIASDSILALIRFLDELQAHQRVIRLEQELLDRGMPDEALRTRQVWDKLCGLLEQMNELLGDERIPLSRFPEWLEEGLSMTEISALPPQENCVQAGPLGELMLRKPRIVFVLGLNQGALNLSDEALLNDKDRGDMEAALHLRMNLTLPDREALKQLDLWKALSLASERLYISYTLSGDTGETQAPLPQLSRIKRLFPQLVEEGGAMSVLRDHQPLTPAAALDEIASLLASHEMEGAWWDAWAWLKEDPLWQEQAKAVQAAALGDDPDKRLPETSARTLFDARAVSVSRLETYAGCPFRHFVDYGLRPHEHREWEIKPVDFGNFCHDALEGFTRGLKDNPAWPHLPREKAEEMMDQVLISLTEGWEEEPWADTPRAEKGAQHYLDVCRRMAWALTEGSQASGFRPLMQEVRFGPGEELPAMEIRLDEENSLMLRGTIDRLDLGINQGLPYVRVVDYKTGSASLDASDLKAGVQLQLLLYLKSALSVIAGSRAAGAFYQKVADPIVTAENGEQAVKEARKTLRLSGVMLADAEIIRLMDGANPPVSLPNWLSASGEPAVKDRLLSREALETLMEVAEDKARELARQIFSGRIPRSPLIRASGCAECAFCQYQGICRTEKISREKLKRRTGKATFAELSEKPGNQSD